MNKTALLLAAMLGLSSCAVTPEGSQDFAAPVAAIATSVVLAKGTASEQKEKAIRLTQVAAGLELISDPDTTGEDISRTVLLYSSGKPEFVAVGASLGLIYDRYIKRAGQNQYQAVIQQIATGVRTAAAPYL